MTVGKKLYTGFSASILITLVMGLVGIRNLGTLGEALTKFTVVTARNLYLAGDVNALSSNMLSSVLGMNLRAHMNQAQESRRLFESAKQTSERLKKEAEEFTRKTSKPNLRDKMQSDVLDKQAALLQALDDDYALLSKGNLVAGDTAFNEKLLPLANSISQASEDLAKEEYAVVVERGEEATSLVVPARNLSLFMIVLALGVGCGVVWVVRGIVAILQSSIVELGAGADQVASAAAQVSSSSQSLAQGASEQAASLEETSASSEEINSMARRNTDNSRSTAELLARSQDKVSQANKYLEEMVVSMDLITDSSGKISKIIKVIDEIAFQTNILALNAAVEAARAGEAGMGFAVVADEVRSLAQRSAQAAKDTATLIEDSITRSNEGKIKVDQVAVAIQAVTQDSTKVKVMVDEVSLGSEEQSRGIDQIGRAISQMEQVTQTNAASAEQGAAAAEHLSAQSETLKDVLARLSEMLGKGSQSLSSVPFAAQTYAPAKPFRPQPATARSYNAPSMRNNSLRGGAPSKPSMPPNPEDQFPLEESFQSF